jgi:zinc and cadmium transporter
MWINIIILLLAALFGGFLAFKFRSAEKFSFDLALTFAGAYLFGITIVHVIPELFTFTSSPVAAGIFVLAGFYLQQFLEYLTSGVEHGHMHLPHGEHKHNTGMAVSLLLGLTVHSLLEGTLLGHPTETASASSLPLLLGIVLHKIPAAFAMMTVLLCQYDRLKWPLIFLIVFAASSPLGVLFSETVELGPGVSEILFALVSGSFLHISTTIVFESSPQHKLKISRIGISILGALVAILVQTLL